MIHPVNANKLQVLHETSVGHADPDVLRREGKVFFIGGNLPIHSTLETMYESYCQESSALFHVTFGAAGMFEHNLEMVRQIKHNFSIRILGRIDYPLSSVQVEQLYLGGLDILDIPLSNYESYPDDRDDADRDRWLTAINAATFAFSRWSVVSEITVEHAAPRAVRNRINEMLANGVIPLLKPSGEGNLNNLEESMNLYGFLAAQWHRHQVPLKPIEPLLQLTTPFDFAEPSGFLQGIIDKIRDRRTLATSDLRRHLRTSGAEASFESASL